ncbi:hypothetical protein [Paenibacillus agricola]|uniref:Spore germination protein n=1 Tax=Paenibacillus agricola TaxID=2716264 RepID=A0ABX0J528_9BACL|nr:hypothetical protein [Paenibacillus agricola]NHN30535.1 hypothetical protein [Paenibacillus agricola]
MGNNKRIEVLLWSIALPGFGQLLNGRVFKGLILISLEFLVNVQSNLNQVIISSFHGEIQQAVIETDYQWLMFYPCVYMFGMWDAYKEAGSGLLPYSYLPFVLAAFLATVGLIYSDKKLWGWYFGPVWLPMLLCFIGVGIGLYMKKKLNQHKPPASNEP